MDNWIKIAEQELELFKELKELRKKQYDKEIMETSYEPENEFGFVAFHKQYYDDLYEIYSVEKRAIEDYKNLKSKDLNNPQTFWSSLTYYMLNSSVDNSDLITKEFEEARMKQEGIVKDSPLGQIVGEIIHRINISVLPRLTELNAYKERAHEPDIQVLRKLLGV